MPPSVGSVDTQFRSYFVFVYNILLKTVTVFLLDSSGYQYGVAVIQKSLVFHDLGAAHGRDNTTSWSEVPRPPISVSDSKPS